MTTPTQPKPSIKAERVDDYHKHGCHFSGKLVVIHYYEAMQQDPNWGKFNANLTFDYVEKARALVKERQYKVVRELLTMPDLVIEIS